MDKQSNAAIINGFVEDIWNKQQFHLLDQYLHPQFTDHSLPPAMLPNAEGMQQWIAATGKSFDHQTRITELITDGDRAIALVEMHLTHTGMWRDLEVTGTDVITTGYRYFVLRDGRIIEHKALIDGQAIENQIKSVAHGCKAHK